jgi:hypothetical protein
MPIFGRGIADLVDRQNQSEVLRYLRILNSIR